MRFLFTLLVGFSTHLTAWAQQSFDFSESSAGSLFNGEAIAGFFASPEFKLIIALIAGLTVLVWIIYLFGTFRMTIEDGEQKRKKLHFPLPSEFIPRVSSGTHFFGPSAPMMIPAQEELNQQEPENEREHYPNRG